MTIADDIPALIKAYRAMHGLSQDGLARHWDMPASTIRGWEQGKRPAQPGMLAMLLREAMEV